jgi:protein gp37
MATKIEWTQETINLAVGCTKCSPGCDNCYAAKLAATRLKHCSDYAGLAFAEGEPGHTGYEWTEEVRLLEHNLEKIIHMRQPRMIFLNSMGDLFHKSVPDQFLDRVFAAIALCPQHTFQMLTKRPDRMLKYSSSPIGGTTRRDWVMVAAARMLNRSNMSGFPDWPLQNLWLGVTAENQEQADKRIPLLLQTPAAVRFVSVEPMLSSVDLTELNMLREAAPLLRYNALTGVAHFSFGDGGDAEFQENTDGESLSRGKLDWVICGGETGQNARPMHPDWVRSLRDQCEGAGVPFYFKSWGEWVSAYMDIEGYLQMQNEDTFLDHNGSNDYKFNDTKMHIWEKGLTPLEMPYCNASIRVGKKRAGRLLDGWTWDEYPEVRR